MDTIIKETRISERMLWLPTLIFIRETPGITTAVFVERLENLLKPIGKDAKKPKGRSDSFFTQIVRNIKSHNSLDVFSEYSATDGWTLNQVGHALLSSNEDIVLDIIDVLEDTTFSYADKIEFLDFFSIQLFTEIKDTKKAKKPSVASSESPISSDIQTTSEPIITPVVVSEKKKPFLYNENDVIKNEGAESIRSVKVRKRSAKLRDAAIKHYKVDNIIKCDICGFDFSKVYDGLGENYIEIHHKKPIYQYEDQEDDIIIANALENLVPVCANCHRMLHRRANVTYDEVVKTYKQQQKLAK